MDIRNYVVKQIPQAMNERKQFALNEFKNEKDQSQFKAKIFDDKLFIKGKEQTQYRIPNSQDCCNIH